MIYTYQVGEHSITRRACPARAIRLGIPNPLRSNDRAVPAVVRAARFKCLRGTQIGKSVLFKNFRDLEVRPVGRAGKIPSCQRL